MAERKSSKKPESLNDSHYRLLQDLLSPPPAAANPSSTPAAEDDKVEMEDLKPPIEGQRVRNLPHFSLTDFESSPEEEKTTKIKIEGRRRLCKVSYRADSDLADKQPVLDKPNISGIADYESLAVPKRNPSTTSANAGGNEIRDILDDLSSRLEFLSIERRVARKADIVEGSNVSETKGEEADAYLPSGQFGDSYVNRLPTKHDGQKKIKTLWVDEKPKTVARPIVPKVGKREVDDEDDCVFLSGNKIVKISGSQSGKVQERYESDELIVINDSTDDCALETDSSITLSGLTSTYKLPGKIARMLFPHQRDGLKWLWSLHCQGKGGILGDDMGLGKTMQICSFLAGLFHSQLIKRVMVVAPKTLLSHWIKELSSVGLADKIREYYGTCAKARKYELQYVFQDKGILLTTYDIVRVNSKSLRGGEYAHDDGSEDIIWDYMILDEGHLIKNPSTQRAKSLLEIPCAHRIIVSGTPLQNNLKELWALFNFCCPELLGDKKCFKEQYESLILRGNEKNALDREKCIGSTVAKELRERIKPFFLRRLKNEVFNEDNDQTSAKLSKKNEIIVWLRLTGCQRKLYEAFLKSELVLSAFDGSPLAALTILKKICDHPLLLTKRAAEDVLEEMDSMLKPDETCMAEKLAMYIADVADREDFDEKHANLSCKISFILSLLEDLIPQGHNVLIFSQTRKMLNLIQESLVSNGYEFVRIDGTTKAIDRMRVVNDFQEGNGAPIFLLTSQVGGLGLTLTRADRVIVVDPAWNPSTDNQSVDRAYRIGQNKDVIVYRLMTCGTVEEKIYRKQIYKGGLFKTATEHKEQIRYFSQQDLCELFSLPKEGFDVSPTQQQLYEEHDRQHTMDKYFKSHIEFLETQGIAGVSHHSLLFSKTAPLPVAEGVEDEVERIRGASNAGSSFSSSLQERNVNGAEYAFKPKDLILNKKPSSPIDAGKLTEAEIKQRINRLSQTLANKALVSRLPDKGEKIQKQIGELNAELYRLGTGEVEGNERNVIDLDDITGEFQRVVI
ncbi:DNA excision repair protein ERCC-6-like [Pyrus ussuriensis x Pyrus communis]|uniref:DNA excision repair protein ERCC-6-like n=1 Tax=Pyrus ussuriensis x Pyrus communis TaxID=2448454 RepID=A0A5N5F7U1_9ROSA|nr:protein CHROMATIN REMODELING 24 isoform X1 [Pyrus x bretschneideri]KAB2597160.1 DNA excision repair protein ERCC-6-like [Pyrus ussuriensis x Pyrus communis]